MGQAIGDMLPAAIGVAISPMPIVAVVLMLISSRGRTNGLAFLVGWWAGIAIVGTVVLLLADTFGTAAEKGQPAIWVGVLQLILGLLLFFVAFRQWRGRPREGGEAKQPRWMHALDRFGPGKSLGAGALFSAGNPKNLLLIIAGAAAIAQADISGGGQAIALVVFMVIASVGVGAPVVLYLVMGDSARERLDSLRGWMARNNATMMAVLLLVLGFKLLGNGISTLAT